MTEEKSKKTIQKFSWKNYKVCDTYEKAAALREYLLDDTDIIKIKRCGPAGTKFAVKIGTPIKTKGAKNATK
jgi:hypothetical protein